MEATMYTKTYLVLLFGLGLIFNGPAFAQEADDPVEGDDTMTVIEENEEPEEIDNTLALPEDASPTGIEHSQFGIDTANQARELRREFGEQRAAEARQGNRDEAVRQDIVEQARQNAQQNAPQGAP